MDVTSAEALVQFRSEVINGTGFNTRDKDSLIALTQTKSESETISDVVDDGSGTIEYEEFLEMMTHKILNRDPTDKILKAFRLFEDDETGKISFKNLKRAAKDLDLVKTEARSLHCEVQEQH